MDEDGGPPGPKKAKDMGKRRKKPSGDRCMVMNCGSTYQTATVHSMPGPMPTGGARFSSLQMSWIHFIQRNRVFDHTKVKQINVCSLHFDKSQYDQTQLRMYELGLRKLPPKLLPNSVPHIYIKPAPAASDRTPTPIPSPSPDAGPSGASGSVVLPVPEAVPVVEEDVGAPQQPAATPDPPHIHNHSSTTSVVYASGSTSSPTSASGSFILRRKKRQRASYCRKKEVGEITKDYSKKAAEALASDILERSKGHQCFIKPKMVHRRVGIRKWQRTCKVQVKPITVSRGKQVNLPMQQVARFCDAVTQTKESSFVVPVPPEDPDEELHVEEETEEEPDDEIKDPTYRPNEGTDSPHKERQAPSQPKSFLTEEKFIVFETNLLELFRICISCLSKNMHVEKVCPRSYGSQLKVVATCLDCGHLREWQSQPKIGDVMAGNLLLSASILYGGASPTKVLRVLRHMNLKVISVQTFLAHQRDYLQPAIIRVVKEEQMKLIREMPEGEGLVLGGDGRADSPGHCAKYGSYVLMDLKTSKIIDMQLVQSNEVTSSNAMEKEGLVRGLASLQEKQIKVDTLVTDRHASVAKLLRENHPDIKHKYDVWHIAKGLKKKIKAISKLQDCEVVGRWKRSIINQVYWCASSTPDGDGDVIVAKYKSILNHIRNVHTDHGDLYPACAHGDQYAQREWMRQGTKAFEKLSEVMTKTRLVNDIKKMSPLQQTSSVESFHSVLLYWCPKMIAYSYAGMKCRLHLAAIHWNENAGRSQATKADGTPMYRLNFPKAKEGGHTVSRVLTACTFNYVTALMEETLQLVSGKQKIRSTIPELQAKPALCSGIERPNKAEAVRQLNENRRFAKE